MKVSKSRKMLVLAIACLFGIVGSVLHTVNVSAGSSNVVIDASSFAEKLDTAKWNNPNGDVQAKDGKIVFTKASTPDTRLITTAAVERSDYHKELFDVDCTMRLNRLPSGEKFIVAFGLSGIESYYEENGSAEIIFENNGSLKVSFVVYDEDGKKTVFTKPVACGLAMGRVFSVSANADKENKVKIVVNGKTICNKKITTELEGRIGLLQTGKCEAEVSNLEIVSHKYDRPENVKAAEDFESGSININAFTSAMHSSCGFYPAGVAVEEYNGSNHVLMFRNVDVGYFGTTHEYSNFELKFDVPYLLQENIFREDNTLETPIHKGFLVALGDESADYESKGYTTAAEGIVFTNNMIYSLKNNEIVADIKEMNLGNAEKNEGYSVKILVLDTTVTVYVKNLNATKYQEVLKYSTGSVTPLGYVHIWSMGQANFAIDNVSIVNKDIDAKMTDAEYKAGFVTGTEDWKYEKEELPYLNVEKNGNNLSSVWVALGCSGVIGILQVAGSLLIVRRKKNRLQKEVQGNEN